MIVAADDRREAPARKPTPPPLTPWPQRITRPSTPQALAQGSSPGGPKAVGAPSQPGRAGVIVREMTFGGAVLRVEHDGSDVVIVLPDGTHLIGSLTEASRLAGELLLDEVRSRR